MDFKILYFLNDLHCEALNKMMIFFTNLGDAGIVWILLAIVLLCFKKTRKCGLLILIAMGIGLIIGNGLIKNVVKRARPCWLDSSIPLLIKKPLDYSFPSGHTLASFEAFVMIFLHNKKWGIVSGLLAVLIAFSRLYLFVHFPTDVLAGAIFGTVISIVTYKMYDYLIPYLKKKEVV